MPCDHAPLSVYCNVLASVHASLIVHYLELQSVCYSGIHLYTSDIGRWPVKRPDVRWTEVSAIKTEVSAIWSVRYKRFHCITCMSATVIPALTNPEHSELYHPQRKPYKADTNGTKDFGLCSKVSLAQGLVVDHAPFTIGAKYDLCTMHMHGPRARTLAWGIGPREY